MYMHVYVNACILVKRDCSVKSTKIIIIIQLNVFCHDPNGGYAAHHR